MDRFEQILKEYWGFDSFRGIQREIIDSIASGHDTMGLMPTGGGKSITFQVPALASEGTCLAITPLIALMKDQVDHLRKRGIKAAAIYSGMTHPQIVTALENCILGDYKLLYISPERIGTEFFQRKLSHMKVSFICVDEAHCISQWGHDFRPSYLEIKQIRRLLPDVPVLALTATATPSVLKNILQELEFKDERVFRMSFERKNLSYIVKRVDGKEPMLKRLLLEKEGSTIIYCRNRSQCKELAETIQQWGYTATYYHAGLLNAEKDERQRKWQNDTYRIMVATNAFGMGIDKPDVRLVVHMGLPNAIESYFQEAGRAGRDGKPSEAILLFNGNDVSILKKKSNELFPDKRFIADVYEEICCYLKTAIGFGRGSRREFNLLDFCKNFHHSSIQVESALNLLTKAGYIRYTDADEGVSRLMFTVKRDALYQTHENEKKLEAIINSLLRNYTGLFIDYVPIDESLLEKQTGLPSQEIYNLLKQLNTRHIISFIPRKNTPHIEFTLDRKEKSEIKISKAIYEDRRSILEERLRCMLEYALEDDVCRNTYLLQYFGEKTKGKCGQCDICIDEKEVEKTGGLFKRIISVIRNDKDETKEKIKTNIREEIIKQISAAGKIHPFDLSLDNYDSSLVKEVLSKMSDDEEIYTDDCLRIALTNNKDK